MKKISVLMGIYNCAPTLSEAIDSILAQTYSNWELILCDDGSTDKSYENCVRAIGRDERFSVIRHEKNKGLGAGRITGLEQVQTEYLTFMDPDDEIEKTTVETLLNDIHNTNSDFITYDYFTKNEKNKVELISDNTKTVKELFEAKSKLISHVWHKVYKKTLLEKIDFSFYKTVSFAEDLWLCTNCFLNAQNPVIIHNAYYYYKYNSSSLVHKRSEKSIRENIEVLKNLLQNPKLKEIKEIDVYIKDDSFHAFGHLIFPSKTNDFQRKPHFEEWRKLDSEIGIFLPEYLSEFVRKYVSFIRSKKDFFAKLMWLVLELKTRK